MKRRKILIIPFLIGFFLGCFTMYFLEKNFFVKGDVLSWQSEIKEEENLTPSPSPSPTPTSTPTPKPTLTPTPIPSSIPTLTPIPSPPVSSEQIHEFIQRFASQYGVDPDLLRHIAVCESGFNPSAVNLNYAGLYQFTPSTWTKYRQLLGKDPNPDLRFNPEEAVQTAAFVLSLNQAYIWPSCVPGSQ